MAIFLSSDLHFNHNKEFVYATRGCESTQHMNQVILDTFNETVAPTDDLWLLGDLFMGSAADAKPLLEQIPGKVHVILGNHDTKARIALYESLGWDCKWADVINVAKQTFYLSHHPMLLSNFDAPYGPWNLHGHTHSSEIFSELPRCFHVGVDAHDCRPIEIHEIISKIKEYNNV